MTSANYNVSLFNASLLVAPARKLIFSLKFCLSTDFIRDLHKTVNSSHVEVKNLRLAAEDLQIKHRSLSKEIQGHRDTSAKYKAQNRRLAGRYFEDVFWFSVPLLISLFLVRSVQAVEFAALLN